MLKFKWSGNTPQSGQCQQLHPGQLCGLLGSFPGMHICFKMNKSQSFAGFSPKIVCHPVAPFNFFIIDISFSNDFRNKKSDLIPL